MEETNRFANDPDRVTRLERSGGTQPPRVLVEGGNPVPEEEQKRDLVVNEKHWAAQPGVHKTARFPGA